MIRVGIVARTLYRARALAELLAEDERMEIADFRAFSGDLHDLELLDVLIVAGVGIEHVKQQSPPVVVLSSRPAEARAWPGMVRAWLTEDALASEIEAAVVGAAAGFTLLTAGQAQSWLRTAAREPAESIEREKLTAREGQVLLLLADGLGNKAIAQELNLSEHTAKFHVAQILAKLGAGSRAEAVAIGMRQGLVTV